MFKPGELASVRGSGRRVVIKEMLRKPHEDVLFGRKVKYPRPILCTSDGRDEILDESDLFPAHPTVQFTASGRHAATEKWAEEHRARWANEPKIDYDLRHKVEQQLQKAPLTVNLRGHWKNGSILWRPEEFKQRVARDMHLLGRGINEDDLRELSEALTAGRATTRWINLGKCMATLSNECSYCGKGYFDLEMNGVEVRLAGDDCPLPNGFEPNEWELNVPSGKIVVANDLREWFPLPEGDDDIPSINTILGCRLTSQAYAAVGMAHASVGNTCPGVYKLKDGSFKIANEPPDEYWDGKAWVPYKRKPKFKGERVAGICTDLWWYSLCDLDEFNRRVEKFGGSLESANAEVIDVKPGVYRFRHNDEAKGQDDRKQETLFATFEWVRPPDQVKNFLKDWMSVEVNPHAFVQAQVKRWPTLYGVTKNGDREDPVPWAEMTEEQRYHAWHRVADHIFCTIGGGTDWHDKGFPLAKVDPTIPDIEPPSFRAQFHWYPFAKSYGGLFAPKTLTPSFVKLAFRVLESVISFGTDVQDGSHSRDVFGTRGRMLLAVKRYRELAKQYPDQADPEYVWWLSQKGRAEKWVKSFDLGPVFTDKHREHAKSQRWVPEDAYAVEFDARKLKDGHFAGKGGWENPKTAPNYALVEWSDNGQPPETNCFWASHAIRTAVPIYSVARVVKVGEVSHMGESLVEVAYDYGTPWMMDPTKRKAIRERDEKDAIRVLTKEEYEALLVKVKGEVQAEAPAA